MNQDALERTIAALTGLTDEHAALIEHARTLAVAVDAVPGEPKLHAEYRQVVKSLLEAGHPEAIDDFERLLADLRD